MNVAKAGGKEKHGLSKTKLYRIWADMLQRCNNPKSNNYKYYGMKGVRVCKEWTDFDKFNRWALANGYKKGLSIDRVDPTGNYEPANCRWTNREGQNNNRRNSVKTMVNGELLTLAQIARKYNFNYSCIQHRYSVGVRGNSLIQPLEPGVKRVGVRPPTKPLKLSYSDISEIKWLLLNTSLTQKEIGIRYGITQVMVSRIKLGKVHSQIKPMRPQVESHG